MATASTAYLDAVAQYLETQSGGPILLTALGSVVRKTSFGLGFGTSPKKLLEQDVRFKVTAVDVRLVSKRTNFSGGASSVAKVGAVGGQSAPAISCYKCKQVFHSLEERDAHNESTGHYVKKSAAVVSAAGRDTGADLISAPSDQGNPVVLVSCPEHLQPKINALFASRPDIKWSQTCFTKNTGAQLSGVTWIKEWFIRVLSAAFTKLSDQVADRPSITLLFIFGGEQCNLELSKREDLKELILREWKVQGRPGSPLLKTEAMDFDTFQQRWRQACTESVPSPTLPASQPSPFEEDILERIALIQETVLQQGTNQLPAANAVTAIAAEAVVVDEEEDEEEENDSDAERMGVSRTERLVYTLLNQANSPLFPLVIEFPEKILYFLSIFQIMQMLQASGISTEGCQTVDAYANQLRTKCNCVGVRSIGGMIRLYSDIASSDQHFDVFIRDQAAQHFARLSALREADDLAQHG